MKKRVKKNGAQKYLEFDGNFVEMLFANLDEEVLKGFSEVRSISFKNVDPSQLSDETAANALLVLLSSMPKLERFSLAFKFDSDLENLEHVNPAVQKLLGFVLSQCENLRALNLNGCAVQAWDEQTWDAFSAYIESSRLLNLNVGPLNLNVAGDCTLLNTLFERTVSIRAFELTVEHFDDENAVFICGLVEKFPNISQLVLHVGDGSSCDLEVFGKKILESTELSIIRIFNGKKEITPECVLAQSEKKLSEKVKFVTQGKGKCGGEEAEAELEQFISGLRTQYSSAKMLPRQIETLMCLFEDLDKLPGAEAKNLEKFIAQLIDWFRSGVLRPSEHFELLNLALWPCSFPLYLDLLDAMTSGVGADEIVLRWGDDVRAQIIERFKDLRNVFHAYKGKQVDRDKVEEFEKMIDLFLGLVNIDILTTLLRYEQSALILECINMKEHYGLCPAGIREEFIQSQLTCHSPTIKRSTR